MAFLVFAHNLGLDNRSNIARRNATSLTKIGPQLHLLCVSATWQVHAPPSGNVLKFTQMRNMYIYICWDHQLHLI